MVTLIVTLFLPRDGEAMLQHTTEAADIDLIGARKPEAPVIPQI